MCFSFSISRHYSASSRKETAFSACDKRRLNGFAPSINLTLNRRRYSKFSVLNPQLVRAWHMPADGRSEIWTPLLPADVAWNTVVTLSVRPSVRLSVCVSVRASCVVPCMIVEPRCSAWLTYRYLGAVSDASFILSTSRILPHCELRSRHDIN